MPKTRNDGAAALRRVAIGALAVLAGAAAGGCTLFYAAPDMEVVDMGLTEETDEGRVLTFVLRAENPNDVPLPLKDVHYRLSLDGRTVFSGRRSAEATVPAKGSQVFTVPVSLTEEEIGGRQSAPYAFSGRAVFRKPGSLNDLLYENEVWKWSAFFGESGTLRFTQEDAEEAEAAEDAEDDGVSG